MCRSVLAADVEDVPIPLDLPKGLVSENAFRWPAQPIAKGGMAQIFAGEDKRLGRTVILKAPREEEHLPAHMIDMFQRRVKAEAREEARKCVLLCATCHAEVEAGYQSLPTPEKLPGVDSNHHSLINSQESWPLDHRGSWAENSAGDGLQKAS